MNLNDLESQLHTAMIDQDMESLVRLHRERKVLEASANLISMATPSSPFDGVSHNSWIAQESNSTVLALHQLILEKDRQIAKLTPEYMLGIKF